MASNSTALDENVSVFYCPYKPIFTWILSDTTVFYVASITSSIASPATILLNILIIFAVWKKRELQTNSNILLASMAVGDFLVGAASMPLSISLDVLLLRKDFSHAICEIAFANQLVLYAAACSSLYHMTVIAWERYIAITRWMEYSVVIRRTRIRKLAAIAWLLAVFTTTPIRILKATAVHYKYINVLNIIFSLPAAVGMVLIGYFYVAVYLGLRKWSRTQEMSCAARVRARRENGVAKRSLVIAAVSFLYYIPSLVVRLLFGEAVPILRSSSFFRWSELLIQLNSLLNPILYWLALNRRFRDVVLKMTNIRKPDAGWISVTSSLNTIERCHSRRIGAAKTPNLQGFKEIVGEEEQPDRITRAGSQDSNSIELVHTHFQSLPNYLNQPSMGKPMPGSSREVRRIISVDVHQPKLANRRKPRIKVTGMTSTGPQKQTEGSKVPNPRSLHNNKTQPVIERLMPDSSCKSNLVVCFDVHQPNPNRGKLRNKNNGGSTKGSQNPAEERSGRSLSDNDNTMITMEKPMPVSSLKANQVIKVNGIATQESQSQTEEKNVQSV